MARPTKRDQLQTEQRLNKFIPSILTWYETVFNNKPDEMTYKDWQYLKYHISKVCLNKVIPDRQSIKGEFEGSAELTIKEEKTLKEIELLTPEQKRKFYAKLSEAENIIKASKLPRKK